MNKSLKKLDKEGLINFVLNRRMKGKAFLLSSEDYDIESDKLRAELNNDFSSRSDFLIKHKDYLW